MAQKRGRENRRSRRQIDQAVATNVSSRVSIRMHSERTTTDRVGKLTVFSLMLRVPPCGGFKCRADTHARPKFTRSIEQVCFAYCAVFECRHKLSFTTKRPRSCPSHSRPWNTWHRTRTTTVSGRITSMRRFVLGGRGRLELPIEQGQHDLAPPLRVGGHSHVHPGRPVSHPFLPPLSVVTPPSK